MSIPASKIVGVLLAGGRSSRMGGNDKCLVALGGRPLLAHAIDRLSPQVGTLVLNANGDPARFAAFGLPVAADTVEGQLGPLAGILAGMEWAKAHVPAAGYVASAATDTPFFPQDLVARHAAAIDGAHEQAIATCAGRDYPVFGLFPVDSAEELARFLRESRNIAAMAWADRRRSARVAFDKAGDADPFLNVNAPEDLARAEKAAASSRL